MTSPLLGVAGAVVVVDGVDFSSDNVVRRSATVHFKESVVIAVHALRVGRLRTALTMLGIVVSVSVVTLVAGLSGGLNDTYRVTIDVLARAVMVTPSGPTTLGGNGPRSLSNADVEALQRDSDPRVIADVVPLVNMPTMMRRGGTNYRANVVGASSGYFRLTNSLVGGTMFTDEQYRDNSRVVLLGPALVQSLFGGDTAAALRGTVLIGRFSFQVIGLVGPDGAGDETALMPVTTARTFLFGGMRTVQSIGVVPVSFDAVEPAIADVSRILDRQHFVKSPLERDYAVASAQSSLAIAHQLLAVLFWFTVAVTGIALFVGALGLANIMLITVTERTCEIGVRRAVGARRGAILRQFLVESVIISGLGGLVGVGAGIGLALVGQHILPALVPLYGPPHLSMDAAMLAFGLSLLIGVVAGGYPAVRAARLQPWDALRS
jgi:putative ABC transport system permease protein